MVADQIIAVRVSPETKAVFRGLAGRQQMTESALLKRAIELMLQSAGVPEGKPTDPRPMRGARLTVRLSPDDQQLLHERAAARKMPVATYASMVMRAHLRSLTPLPKEELRNLRRSIAELIAVGRNLNQVVRLAHQSGRLTGPSKEDLRGILKVCEGLRDHVRAPLQANREAWERGYA